MSIKHFKVVMTDSDFGPYVKYIEKEVAKVGAEFIPAQCKTIDEVIELAKDADGIVTEYIKPIGREVMSSLEKCKVIARTGIGVDTIDIKQATEFGICVVNVPDYCLEEASEQAIALVLACARKTVLLSNSVKNGKWDFKIAKPIYRLNGKTLGIVGYGKIGRRLAQKAKGLGLKIVCYDPYIDQAIPGSHEVKQMSFEELIRVSDFISIHVPLTDKTKGMFSEPQFKSMKKTAYIINTSRGPIIDNRALARALGEGWLAGAGLDVMEVEPVPADEPLLKMDNVVITPHTAFYSEESIIDLLTTVGQEVARVITGKRPISLVNPEVLARVDLL